MAGHVEDRWYKTVAGPDGKPVREKTDRYGTGLRYRARFIGPDGNETNKSFPNRQKRLAEEWLLRLESDMARGEYIDPAASKTTFQQYGERWLAAQTTDPGTRVMVEMRLRLHAFPHLGTRPLRSFQPAHIRDWVKLLEDKGLAASYARTIYGNVRAMLSAAVDDGYLPRNPCSAGSVRAPKIPSRRVIPWTPERVFAVRNGLPAEYQPMGDLGAGCGLRQGEIFGFGPDGLDLDTDTLFVVRQVKLVNNVPVFAPPKGGRLRDVPLPRAVANRLKSHMDTHPPIKVTLPWLTPKGKRVTHELLFTTGASTAVRRENFNVYVWKPALVAAGVIPPRVKGQRHTSAREHGMHALRHFYASVLLDAGESIKAVSEYLGHADPGFTLRVYAHLMPQSRERTSKAIDRVFSHDHGPQTAQDT